MIQLKNAAFLVLALTAATAWSQPQEQAEAFLRSRLEGAEVHAIAVEAVHVQAGEVNEEGKEEMLEELKGLEVPTKEEVARRLAAVAKLEREHQRRLRQLRNQDKLGLVLGTSGVVSGLSGFLGAIAGAGSLAIGLGVALFIAGAALVLVSHLFPPHDAPLNRLVRWLNGGALGR